MRLIDADKAIKHYEALANIRWNEMCAPVSWTDAFNEFILYLEEAPTVDAVEVVRCKDCKYWENGKDYVPYCNHFANMMTDSMEDDFCSYGERKEGDDND